jgi:AraC-like DNA-binding protein
MMQEFGGQAFGRLAVLQAQLRILLVYAQRHYVRRYPVPLPAVDDQLVGKYIHLVDVYFRQFHQVQEYAKRLGITPGHLTDITRQRTGLAAGIFIHRRIVLEAKRLLAFSEQTVAEVGHSLNFEDPAYFTRFFRRECGITPTQFRTEIRKKYQHLRSLSL